MPGKKIPSNPSQLAALKELNAYISEQSLPRIAKRLKVLIALSEGRSVDEISQVVGITRQAIGNIRKAVAAHGVDGEIAKFKNAIERNRPKPRGRVGRPPIPSLSVWTEKVDASSEPIVDLIQVVIAGQSKWAVIGVRPARTRNSALNVQKTRQVQGAIRAAFESREPAKWTTNAMDSAFEFVLWRLGHAVAETTAAAPPGRFTTTEHLQTFPVEWRFFVLHTGTESPFVDVPVLNSRVVRTAAVEPDEFLETLERIICHLRIHVNLIGLFPSFSDAEMPGRNLQTPRTGKPLFWALEEKDIEKAACWRLVMYYVYALEGMVFRLSSRMRRQIPEKETIRSGTLELLPRVRVRVHPLTRRKVIVDYQPVPQIGYEYVTDRERVTPTDSQKELRKRRRAQRQIYFEYSTRLLPGQVTSAFPTSLYRARPNPEGTRIAVVSVPRQFLMEAPALPLRHLAGIAAQMSKPVARFDGTHLAGGHPALAYFSPQLLSAVEKAFRDGRYAARIERIREVDELYRGELFQVLRNLPPQSTPNLGLPPRASYQASEPLVTTFEALLKRSDADFLLREIDEAAWDELTKSVQAWSAACSEVIATHYWKGSHIRSQLVWQAIPSHLREEANKRPEAVKDWTMEALAQFAKSSSRILRHAVETAQRLVLSNLPPLCIAIRTEASVLRSWKRYLSSYIMGRISDALKDEGRPRKASPKRNRANMIPEPVVDFWETYPEPDDDGLM